MRMTRKSTLANSHLQAIDKFLTMDGDVKDWVTNPVPHKDYFQQTMVILCFQLQLCYGLFLLLDKGHCRLAQ